MSVDGLSDRRCVTVGNHGLLGVDFTWRNGRFHQTIFRQSHDVRCPLATSCEEDTHGPWPLSPVLQQLDDVDLPDGRRGIVGLGMAGQNHWSLSIEPTEDGSLRYDVACRVKKGPPTFLGSTFQAIGQSPTSGKSAPDRESPEVGPGPLELVSWQADTQIERQADRWIARPAVACQELSTSATVRWCFSVRLTA